MSSEVEAGGVSADRTDNKLSLAQRLLSLIASLDSADTNVVRSLAVGLHDLGEIRRERQRSNCVAAYEESLAIHEAIGNQHSSAICSFNLGHAYRGIDVPEIRDLVKAEHWYRRSLEFVDEQDHVGRARCLGAIGAIAFERSRDSQSAGEPRSKWEGYYNEAVQLHEQTLALLPESAVKDLAVVHHGLGSIYAYVEDIDRALLHYREAIQLNEAAGDTYAAAKTRFRVASSLALSNRLSDAREYARAALRNFQSYGDRAADMVARTEQLLALIEQAIQEQGS